MNNDVKIFKTVKEFQDFLSNVDVLPFNINRDVDKRNGIALRSSILEHGIQSDLVLVETSIFSKNKKKELYTLDGQHRRIEILSIDPKKIKGTPTVRINYSESIEDIVNLVSTLNTAGKKWNLENYAKAWANSSCEQSNDYQKLIDFKNAYKITMDSAIILLARKEKGNTSFKLGRFVYKKDERVNSILEVYETALTSGLQKSPGSFKALVKLYGSPNFSVKRYLKNVRLNAHLLKTSKSTDYHIEILK